MKGTTLTIMSLLTALIFASCMLGSVNLASANWVIPVTDGPPAAPEISVLYPEPNIICGSNVDLEFLVTGPSYHGGLGITWVGYSLDGKPTVTLNAENYTVPDAKNLVVHFLGGIKGLSRGSHSLKIYAKAEGQYSTVIYQSKDFEATGASAKIEFTVDPLIRDTSPPEIEILSPKEQTCNTSSVPLTVWTERFSHLTYTLDEQDAVAIASNTTLSRLSDGNHNLTVTASDISGNSKSATTSFMVNLPPKIKILSIPSDFLTTYNATSVPLEFSIDKPVAWIGYSMDGKADTTIFGNTTLTGFSNGTHQVTVYAKDAAGNIGEKGVFFIVEAAGESPPFPTFMVATASASTIVAIAGIIVYLKKRRH